MLIAILILSIINTVTFILLFALVALGVKATNAEKREKSIDSIVERLSITTFEMQEQIKQLQLAKPIDPETKKIVDDLRGKPILRESDLVGFTSSGSTTLEDYARSKAVYDDYIKSQINKS